jgi:hypothetical protein
MPTDTGTQNQPLEKDVLAVARHAVDASGNSGNSGNKVLLCLQDKYNKNILHMEQKYETWATDYRYPTTMKTMSTD